MYVLLTVVKLKLNVLLILTPELKHGRSNYKHSNTIKYLIGITPAGAVSSLSHGWGGRVSKEITLKSMGTAYLLIVGLQLQWLHVELD